MDFIQTIPALIRLLAVFTCLILCIRMKWSLGNTFLTGSALSGILFGLSPEMIVKTAVMSAFFPKTIALSLVILLILVLSRSMEDTGQMKALLASFKGLIKNSQLNIIVFPAIIGLLPMPGGAVFSAPMVKELGADLNYSPSRLSFVNYWFRHIWEYWWPMYPGILLVPAMTDIGLGTLMLYLCPLTVFAVLIGYSFLETGKKEADTTDRPKISPFLWQMIPILIAVFPGLLTGVLFSHAFPEFTIAKETGLIIALLLASAWVWGIHRVPLKQVKNLFDSRMIKMVYMIFAILVFKDILETSHAVDAILKELTLLNVPVLLVVAILPFLTGLITGISVAFVGSTFPILLPMVSAMDTAPHLAAYIMVAMVCGFMGVLLSPMHLCLILSNEYFVTGMGSVYRYLGKACILLAACGFLYFYVLTL